MSRELRLGVAGLAALGTMVFAFLVIGNLGPPRPGEDPLTVAEVLSGGAPAERFGDAELHVVGWYAELAGDCEGDDGGTDASVAWLQRTCPLRVLLPAQPSAGVTQAALEASGVRLTAPQGRAFPSRADPAGPNTREQQLVFVGHFDDPAAAGCVTRRAERCRNTFVATDYEPYVR